MTAPQTDATTDPQSVIAALQQRLDAATGTRRPRWRRNSPRATRAFALRKANSTNVSSIRPRPSMC